MLLQLKEVYSVVLCLSLFAKMALHQSSNLPLCVFAYVCICICLYLYLSHLWGWLFTRATIYLCLYLYIFVFVFVTFLRHSIHQSSNLTLSVFEKNKVKCIWQEAERNQVQEEELKKVEKRKLKKAEETKNESPPKKHICKVLVSFCHSQTELTPEWAFAVLSVLGPATSNGVSCWHMLLRYSVLQCYSMIIWNWNKVNAYISGLELLLRLPNRSKRP